MSSETPHIYAISADDPALLDLHLAALKQTLLQKGYATAWNRLSAKEVKWDALRGAWQSLSFFGGEVYYISGCETWKKEAWEELAWFMETPDSPHVLILCGTTVDQRYGVVKRLKEAGRLSVLAAPKRGEWTSWTMKMAKDRYGLSLSPVAAGVLREVVGEAPWQVMAAVALVSLYCGNEKAVVDEALIARCLGAGSQDDIFDFTGHVAARHVDKALLQVAAMMEKGIDALYIVAMLRRHYKILITLGELDKNLPAAEKAKLCGAPVYFLAEYEGQLRRYRSATLVRIYHDVARLDQTLKSEKTPALLQLSNWILSLR